MEKRKRRGSGEKRKTQAVLILFVVIAVVISAFEVCGTDPVRWVKDKLGGSGGGTDDELYVHFIDVGQGDCIFLTCGGENMLVDCGEASYADSVISYLNNQGVGKIDYAVATHPHSDHMGGMYRIVEQYEIGEMIMPHVDDSDIPTTRFFEKFLDSCEEKGLKITEAGPGDILKIGDAKAEVLSPESGKYDELNNYSVVLMVEHGENRFLLTGDAEKEAENEMTASGKLSHVNVYKAGHHGSNSSSTKNFLREITPDAAVIMCGAGNSYGHPSDAAVKRLTKYTDEIYRTDLDGTIVFRSDGSRIEVKTEASDK